MNKQKIIQTMFPYVDPMDFGLWVTKLNFAKSKQVRLFMLQTVRGVGWITKPWVAQHCYMDTRFYPQLNVVVDQLSYFMLYE